MFSFCFPFFFGEFLFYTALGCRCHLVLLATPIKTLFFLFFFSMIFWFLGKWVGWGGPGWFCFGRKFGFTLRVKWVLYAFALQGSVNGAVFGCGFA
jgi:hypothetical protein